VSSANTRQRLGVHVTSERGKDPRELKNELKETTDVQLGDMCLVTPCSNHHDSLPTTIRLRLY